MGVLGKEGESIKNDENRNRIQYIRSPMQMIKEGRAEVGKKKGWEDGGMNLPAISSNALARSSSSSMYWKG